VTRTQKLKHGEFRLPGEARERMFKLHSGISGVYDPVDRFLMLADVAPHSDSFKHYRAIVQGWRSSGVLDDYWSDKIDTTQEQVKQKLARYQVYYRRFTGLALPYKMVEPSEHNMAERFIGGAWERLMLRRGATCWYSSAGSRTVACKQANGTERPLRAVPQD